MKTIMPAPQEEEGITPAPDLDKALSFVSMRQKLPQQQDISWFKAMR